MARYFWAMVLGLLLASGVHGADNKKPAPKPAPKPGGGSNTNKNNNNNNANRNNNNQQQRSNQQAYLQSQYPSALSGMMMGRGGMGGFPGMGGYGGGMGGMGMGGMGMGGMGMGGRGYGRNNPLGQMMAMMNMLNRMNQMGNGSGFTDITIMTDSDTSFRVAYAPKDATAEDKKTLKGDDPKKPGYTGSADDLKVGETVRVSRAKKRTPDPNKPDEVRYYNLPDLIGTVQKIDGTSQFVVRVQNQANYGAIPMPPNGRYNRQQQQQNRQNNQPQPADPEVTTTTVLMYNKVTDSGADKVTKNE
jgi:hypothetical protein